MIRFATMNDVPAMLEIYGPYVLDTCFSFEYTVPTQEEFSRRLEDYTRQLPWLVWEEDGRVLGYAYGSLPFTRAAYDWCGEVSIYLDPEIQGKGVGRKLYAALEEIMFRQGYRVIYSLITTKNQNSIDFHRHLGYEFTAQFPDCGLKFGQWLGIIWMEKRSKLVDLPTFPPVPWFEIVNNNQKLQNILDDLSLS